MSLEQAASLSQVVEAVALLASLVFVGLQIRQNTLSQRVVAVDGLSAAIAAINVPGMQSPALGEALCAAARDWSAASRDQRIIAHYFLLSYFKLAEDAWYQQKAKMLEPAQWEGWEMMVRFYYHSPGVQSAWWPRRRSAFSRPFQEYLSATSPAESLDSLSGLFDNRPLREAPEGGARRVSAAIR